MFKFSKKFLSLIMAILMLTMTAIGVNAEELITGIDDLLVDIGIIDPSPEEELMPMAATTCLPYASKYEKYDENGDIYSVSFYDNSGNEIARIDYQGTAHFIDGEYRLPHQHNYSYHYGPDGKMNKKDEGTIYSDFWEW